MQRKNACFNHLLNMWPLQSPRSPTTTAINMLFHRLEKSPLYSCIPENDSTATQCLCQRKWREDSRKLTSQQLHLKGLILPQVIRIQLITWSTCLPSYGSLLAGCRLEFSAVRYATPIRLAFHAVLALERNPLNDMDEMLQRWVINRFFLPLLLITKLTVPRASNIATYTVTPTSMMKLKINYWFVKYIFASLRDH